MSNDILDLQTQLELLTLQKRFIATLLQTSEASKDSKEFQDAFNKVHEVMNTIALTNEVEAMQKLQSIQQELEVVIACKDIFSKKIIAIGGGFSTGKSEFISSLFDSTSMRLPSSMEPTTAIPTYVTHTDSKQTRIEAINFRGATINLSKIDSNIQAKLSHQFIESFDFHLKDIMPYLIVHTRFENADYTNICFIDTPGYNPSQNKSKQNDINIAKEFLENTDTLLWFVQAQGGTIQNSDIEFLQQLNLEHKKLYIVLNKADLKPRDQLEEIMDTIEEALDDNAIIYEGISAYSSRNKKEYAFRKSSLYNFITQKYETTGTCDALIKSLDEVQDLYVEHLKKEIKTTTGIIKLLNKSELDIYQAGLDEDAESLLQALSTLKKHYNKNKIAEYEMQLKNIQEVILALDAKIHKIFGIESTKLQNPSKKPKGIASKTKEIQKLYYPKTREELKQLVLDDTILLGTIDTSAITDMSCLFENSERTHFSGIETWDTSNVTDMSDMFCGAKSFNQPLDSWDTRNVTDMSGMFYGAESFNQPLDSWNVSNVTDMSCMFCEAEAFNQPLDSWDTSNVADMRRMFEDAKSFNQPLDSWDTSNVVDMSCMFYNAKSFNQPLDTWDTSNVTNMSSMFKGAKSFNHPINNWNVANVTSMSLMFYWAEAFNQPLDSWDTSNVTNMKDMFYRCRTFNHPINNWNVANVVNMNGMFCGAESFNQSLNSWDTSNVTNMGYMFHNAKSFNQPLDSWDTSNVADRSSMFEGVNSFNYSRKPVKKEKGGEILNNLGFSNPLLHLATLFGN